jgi:MFS family permease
MEGGHGGLRPAAQRGRRGGGALLLALPALGFVSLGLPDGVLGVAWPSIRATFGLRLDALGALLISTTAGYALSSFSSGWLLSRISVGTLLALSCGLTAASLAGYASAPNWGIVIMFGVVAGLGAGAIDAGINTYIATRHSARTLSLCHAAYGLGTAGGPALLTSILMSGSSWRHGYLAIAIAQLALGPASPGRGTPGPRRRGLPPRPLPPRSRARCGCLPRSSASPPSSSTQDSRPAPAAGPTRF